MRCDVFYSGIKWKRWILPVLFWVVLGLPGVALAAEIGDDPGSSRDGNRLALETREGRNLSQESALRETGPIRVKLKDAILMTLENNRTLEVERLNPLIQRIFEQTGAGGV